MQGRPGDLTESDVYEPAMPSMLGCVLRLEKRSHVLVSARVTKLVHYGVARHA